MKLRKHREDVADLKLMQDAHVQEIAKRYLNLIRMAEEIFNWHNPDDEDDFWDRTKRENRVLKDSEVKG